MALIEADADARRPAEQIDDLREMFEPVAEIGALAGRVFEEQPRPAAWPRREDLGEAVRDQPQTTRLRSRRIRPRMHDEAVESERFGAVQLLAERVDRSPPQRGIGGGDVDQVTVV